MKKIQKMPDIWDCQLFQTSRSTILGELASHAINQSPYLMPEKLSEALIEFNIHFDSDGEEYFVTSCKGLAVLIREIIDLCPIILSWNNPKKGDHDIVFVARSSQPSPDHDFIDLDALARNVAHAITLQEKYRELHD